MKRKKLLKNKFSEAAYKEPIADIVRFSREDVVSTSGAGDSNQGPWDSQTYSRYPNY